MHADADRNGELTLQELEHYCHEHPDELRSITNQGSPAWGDLMGLFQYDTNCDGLIQREEWVWYYVNRATELASRIQAEDIQAGNAAPPLLEMTGGDDKARKDALTTFERADENGDGELTMMELEHYIHQHPEELRSITEPGSPGWGDLMGLFEYDTNCDGLIQRDEWVWYCVARNRELRSKAEAEEVKANLMADPAAEQDLLIGCQYHVDDGAAYEDLLLY